MTTTVYTQIFAYKYKTFGHTGKNPKQSAFRDNNYIGHAKTKKGVKSIRKEVKWDTLSPYKGVMLTMDTRPTNMERH